MVIKYPQQYQVVGRTIGSDIWKSLAPWLRSCLQAFVPAVPSSWNTLPEIPNISLPGFLQIFLKYQLLGVAFALLKLETHSSTLCAFPALFVFISVNYPGHTIHPCTYFLCYLPPPILDYKLQENKYFCLCLSPLCPPSLE